MFCERKSELVFCGGATVFSDRKIAKGIAHSV